MLTSSCDMSIKLGDVAKSIKMECFTWQARENTQRWMGSGDG